MKEKQLPEKIWLHPWGEYGTAIFDREKTEVLNAVTVLTAKYSDTDEEYVRADIMKAEVDSFIYALEKTKRNLACIMDDIPQWLKFPTDRSGFGLYDKVFSQSDCIIMYKDGTIIKPADFDDELAGEIERHPDRYMWMRVGKPFEDE